MKEPDAKSPTTPLYAMGVALCLIGAGQLGRCCSDFGLRGAFAVVLFFTAGLLFGAAIRRDR